MLTSKMNEYEKKYCITATDEGLISQTTTDMITELDARKPNFEYLYFYLIYLGNGFSVVRRQLSLKRNCLLTAETTWMPWFLTKVMLCRDTKIIE
jgi:hypothetical protein